MARRPLSLVSSSSSPRRPFLSSASDEHRALSSHLHRLLSPCQLLGSASSVASRRKALKELIGLIKLDSHSHAALAAADRPRSCNHDRDDEWGVDEEEEGKSEQRVDDGGDEAEADGSGGRYGVSWCVIIRNAVSLARADHNSKRPTAEVWEALRYCVDSAERQQHLLATISSPSLLAELVSLVRRLLSNATDAATLSVCAPAATHLTLLLLSHPPYLSHIPVASLVFFFRFYSLMYRAILSSKDEVTCKSAVAALTADSSFFNTAAIVPPPASLFRFGQPIAHLLSAIIQHFPPAQLAGFFLDHVFPFFAAAAASQRARPTTSPQLTCFSSSSFATLLSGLYSSLQRHYAILHAHVAHCLPATLSSLLSCWPLSTHSGSSLQVKQAASSLLSWSFALQLHSPHRTLRCFVPLDCSHPLAVVCLHELRQPLLFTQHGLELHEQADVITSRIAQPLSVNEGTYRFVHMCVQLFHALELQQVHGEQRQEEREDDYRHESKEAVQAERDGDSADMHDDTKDGGPVPGCASSPLGSLGGGEQRERKRRKAVHAVVYSAGCTPLQQCLSALSETVSPSLSLFHFLLLFSSCPSSSSLLFSSVHVGLLLETLQSLCRFMRRGKSPDVRLWSVACATTLASAQYRHGRLMLPHDLCQLQSSWAEIASVAFSQLLHDDKRIVRQHAVSLLASLLHHQLVPQALQASVHGLLAELPRLSAGSDMSAGDAAMISARGGVKAEMKRAEDDVADSPSAAAGLTFSLPQTECSAAAAKLIAACYMARYRDPAHVYSDGTAGLAAPLPIAVAKNVDALLIDWLLQFSSRPSGRSLVASEWHQLALRLLVNRAYQRADESTAALVSSPLSWTDIDMPACSLNDARPLSYHRSPPTFYPASTPFCLSLDAVRFDSVADMESFMHTAQFARLLPLPSHIDRLRPSAKADTIFSGDATSASFVEEQLPRLRQHVHSLLSSGAEADDEKDADDSMRCLRSHVHFLRLLAPLVQQSDEVVVRHLCGELIAPLLGSFAALLLSFVPSTATLSSLHQLVLDMHDIVSGYPALLSMTQSNDCPPNLNQSCTALSSSLVLQLHGLIERADETTASLEPGCSATRSSSPTADASTASMAVARDDFDGDDDGSRDDYHANSSGAATSSIIASLLAPTLRSWSSYRPCLLAIYRLLLSLLANGLRLHADQRQAILALAQQPTVPFAFPVLFLVSLHDSYIDGNNVQLLMATRTVCDTATAAIEQQRHSNAVRRSSNRQSSKRGTRKRKGRSEAEMDDDEEEDDDGGTTSASDEPSGAVSGEEAELPVVAVEAIAYFLHLCHFVVSGHIELSHEPESGVEQSEEDMLRAYCDTLINAAFPSTSPSCSNPLSISPLLRCLCSRSGLASGLLTSWSLPSSLFPLLSLSPSASTRAIVSHTVSSLIEFSADKEQLWDSSSRQLLDLLSDVRGVQVAANERHDAVASAGCDDRLYSLLGCMCSLACHSLYWQRRSLLQLIRLYGSAAEGSKWMARSILQQTSEAMGYTRLSTFPPSVVAQPKVLSSTSAALSLFVDARTSVVEEHLLYLLTEWMGEPTAQLRDFPFELLSLSSSIDKPFAVTSSTTSFLRYDATPLSSSLLSFMPHVLRACLLHLPARQITLRSLPSLVNERQLSPLLALHWPSLFSLLYSLYADDAAATRDSADRLVVFLKRELTDRTFQSLYKSHPAAPIVCQLLSLVALSPSHAALPSYGVDELGKSLIQLAQQKAANPTSTSVSDLLLRPGDDQLLHIVLHVRASLYSEYMSERQWLWLQALETVIKRLGDSVARGYVCSALLDCLVALLDESDDRFPDHVGSVAALIAALMQRVASVAWQSGTDEASDKGTSGHTDMTTEQVGQRVRFVILLLLNYATTDDRCDRIRRLVSSLIASVPANSHTIFSPLSLLSRHPCITSLPCPYPASLPSALSSFLFSFDDLSDHTNTECMLPLLRALHTELSDRQSELVAVMHPDSKDSLVQSTTGAVQRPDSKQAERGVTSAQSLASPSPSSSLVQSMQRVIASLLLLCRSPLRSSEMSDMAAQCLGCVGVLDPAQLENSYFTLFSASSRDQQTAPADTSCPTGSNLPSCFSASFSRWQQLGGGMDFHAASVAPAASVSWFHVHRHYHSYLLYLLSVGLRSASLLRQQLSYATLLSIFTGPGTATDAQVGYRALSSNAALLLGPFYTRSQQLQAKAGKRGDGAAELSPLSSVLVHMATLPADRASSARALDTATAVVGRESAFSFSLWSPQGQERDQWLSTLAFHLLRTECSDKLLSLMSDCALIDSQSAERLLPLAIMEVLCSDRVDAHEQLAQALTSSMREALADDESEPSTKLRFLSPLLSSIQYVREQLLVLLRQPVPATVKAASPSVLTEADAALVAPPAAPPASLFTELCARLKRFLGLLDPLLMAEAADALQWNNYALLWLEQWNDDRATQQRLSGRERGRKRKHGLDASADSQQDKAQVGRDTRRYHELLLSAYRRMNEPDALAGLLHCTPTSLSASLAADRIQAEMKRDWATVLSISDKQRTPESLMVVLRQMQCSHLLSAYASTLPVASAAEQRMETAWREAEFDASETHVSGRGFHALLYSVLRSRSRGQLVDAALLSEARHGLQSRLDVLHPERVSDVFPLMSQLLLLAAVGNPQLLTHRLQSASALSPLEFDLMEPLLAVQTSMLSKSPQSAHQLVSHLCLSSSLARQAGHPLLAGHNIMVAGLQISLIDDSARQLEEGRLRLVHAQLIAQQGNTHASAHEIKSVLQSMQHLGQEQLGKFRLVQESHSFLGAVLSDSHTESTDKVGEYLNSGATIRTRGGQAHADYCLVLAIFRSLRPNIDWLSGRASLCSRQLLRSPVPVSASQAADHGVPAATTAPQAAGRGHRRRQEETHHTRGSGAARQEGRDEGGCQVGGGQEARTAAADEGEGARHGRQRVQAARRRLHQPPGGSHLSLPALPGQLVAARHIRSLPLLRSLVQPRPLHAHERGQEGQHSHARHSAQLQVHTAYLPDRVSTAAIPLQPVCTVHYRLVQHRCWHHGCGARVEAQCDSSASAALSRPSPPLSVAHFRSECWQSGGASGGQLLSGLREQQGADRCSARTAEAAQKRKEARGWKGHQRYHRGAGEAVRRVRGARQQTLQEGGQAGAAEGHQAR